jgi:hypothetical protein
MTDEIDPRPGETFERVRDGGTYAKNGEMLLFVSERTAEEKRALFAHFNGIKTAENTIVILRANDSQSLRHGGVRQYRSFEAYVNAVKVETWRDDDSRHGYASDRRLDERIDEWGKLWSRALGCPVVRGELRGRVRLIQERKR